MKTFKQRIVSSKKLSDREKREYKRFKGIMAIPDVLEIDIRFAVIPDVLEGVILESDKDIEEKWLAKKIGDKRYHACHLHMTREEWKKCGIRPDLKGQAHLVNNQAITYGRDIDVLWHEDDHAMEDYFKMPEGGTHYHFKGLDRLYTSKEEKILKPKPTRTPDPEIGWRRFPWHLLDLGLSNRERLLQTAVAAIGMDVSPNDLVPDEFGCAETMTMLLRDIDQSIPVITGTWTLWKYLEDSGKFIKVDVPMPGDIIISPTGTGNGNLKNGHVGVVEDQISIMSNDSPTGKFLRNSTFDKWKKRYVTLGGYKMLFYRLI